MCMSVIIGEGCNWFSKEEEAAESFQAKFNILSFVSLESESEVAQSCPTLCDPVDCTLPGSSIHGILQAVIPEWVAISFSRGSSRPRNQTWVSRIGGRRFNLWVKLEGNPKTIQRLNLRCINEREENYSSLLCKGSRWLKVKLRWKQKTI